MAEAKTYGADKIQVLEGLEAVQKRPAMYIGSTDFNGLHHLVYEVVDNSIDEALAGFCDNIVVTIQEGNTLEVIDNGRGIPVGPHPQYKKSALEIVMTKLHAGGKFDGKAYKVSGGLHGVGISVVNALSKELTAEVYHEGQIYRQTYKKGKPVAAVKKVGPTSKKRTRIIFFPDDDIFETTTFNFDTLSKRLRELAFLNAGLKIVLRDEREKGKEHVFQFKGESGRPEGPPLSRLVMRLNDERKP